MTKVCFLTVAWLEEARYTADNLLIAKKMFDYGKPLNPDLTFYVRNSNNDSSLFWEAINSLFSVQMEIDEEDKTVVLLTNSEMMKWRKLEECIRKTSMYEGFRMAQKGLESILEVSSNWFDGKLEGVIKSNFLQLTLTGYREYILYSEYLEELLLFFEELKNQLLIWEEHYEQNIERNQ